MKTLLTFFFLLISSSVFAEDIADFEIEGISIGDSLLDHINLNKINLLRDSQTSGSKKYKRYYSVKKDVNNYDAVDVWVLDNDSKYIIQSLTGVIEYTKNISECYPKKKDIVSSIQSQLNTKGDSYTSNYDNNTSKSDVTDFEYKNGYVRIWCTDYSKIKEDKGYGDFLSVTVSDAKFVNWINTKAYK